jgi:hypothetical protein
MAASRTRSGGKQPAVSPGIDEDRAHFFQEFDAGLAAFIQDIRSFRLVPIVTALGDHTDDSYPCSRMGCTTPQGDDHGDS